MILLGVGRIGTSLIGSGDQQRSAPSQGFIVGFPVHRAVAGGLGLLMQKRLIYQFDHMNPAARQILHQRPSDLH